jgi:hypothetical protein
MWYWALLKSALWGEVAVARPAKRLMRLAAVLPEFLKTNCDCQIVVRPDRF